MGSGELGPLLRSLLWGNLVILTGMPCGSMVYLIKARRCGRGGIPSGMPHRTNLHAAPPPRPALLPTLSPQQVSVAVVRRPIQAKNGRRQQGSSASMSPWSPYLRLTVCSADIPAQAHQHYGNQCEARRVSPTQPGAKASKRNAGSKKRQGLPPLNRPRWPWPHHNITPRRPVYLGGSSRRG